MKSILLSASFFLVGVVPIQAQPLVLVSASYQKDIIALVELDGTVVWQHRTAGPKQGHAGHHEVQMLSNGNILFHDDWDTVKEIQLDGTEVWSYTSSDVHAFTRLPNGNTMIAESGQGRILIVDPAGKLVSETPLGKGGRGKTRQVEVLADGNFLVCAENPGTVTEYKPTGEVVWEYEIGTRVYGAIRLRNGNTLIGSGSGNSIVEVTPDKQLAWEIKGSLPQTDIKLHWVACLEELLSGNILVDNCHAGPDNPQLIELDREHRVVWQLNAFDLVGNGMACFDYVDEELASKVRRQIVALGQTK